MHKALRRLNIDLKEISNKNDNYDEYFSIKPVTSSTINCEGEIVETENMFHWEGIIHGPSDTPYYNGVFKIDIRIPDTYPMVPPIVKFITRIYHPNIAHDGKICLNILRHPPGGDWAPSIGLAKTILSIHNLLSDGNPSDPLNAEAADLNQRDIEAFNAKALSWTIEYAQ